LVPLPTEGKLSYATTIEQAVAGADFIQESTPERLALKQDLLASVSAAAAPDALICSSTSGLRPSDLQERMRSPERLVVGHPFNPVYLVPLVEVCGGARTSPEAIERATGVYRALGMQPVVVRNEIDGFLADRLMEAMWREALWLVHDGVATTQELDDVIRYGPGLRWAFLGTFLTYRIAGGEQGMRHFIAQFGPALQAPWTKLTDVPEMTESFIERIVEQSDLQAAGRSIAELELERDDCLVALLQALRTHGEGAGETVARWERALLETPDQAAGADGWQTPLRSVRREIPTAWIDYNGHVTESRYLELFADANDVVLRLIGVDAAYLESGRSHFTVETHISHLGQLVAGDRVTVTDRTELGWERDGDDEARCHDPRAEHHDHGRGQALRPAVRRPRWPLRRTEQPQDATARERKLQPEHAGGREHGGKGVGPRARRAERRVRAEGGHLEVGDRADQHGERGDDLDQPAGDVSAVAVERVHLGQAPPVLRGLLGQPLRAVAGRYPVVERAAAASDDEPDGEDGVQHPANRFSSCCSSPPSPTTRTSSGNPMRAAARSAAARVAGVGRWASQTTRV
jgi:carnitine 3-dehydrogenase